MNDPLKKSEEVTSGIINYILEFFMQKGDFLRFWSRKSDFRLRKRRFAILIV